MSRELRMVLIFAITFCYSPWLLFYVIIGSFVNTKIILFVLLIGLLAVVHFVVHLVGLVITMYKRIKQPKQTQDPIGEHVLFKTRESWRTKIYEEIVFR
mmetsp:Transcript_38368/g.43966  ORF Transcript_38368/g.43966 Transcript_38368/m.43966 type:complete len:99 (+) Transcript_38368:131-427(+)